MFPRKSSFPDCHMLMRKVWNDHIASVFRQNANILHVELNIMEPPGPHEHPQKKLPTILLRHRCPSRQSRQGWTSRFSSKTAKRWNQKLSYQNTESTKLLGFLCTYFPQSWNGYTQISKSTSGIGKLWIRNYLTHTDLLPLTIRCIRRHTSSRGELIRNHHTRLLTAKTSSLLTSLQRQAFLSCLVRD